MDAPWDNAQLQRAFDEDFTALVAFASRSKARVGFGYLLGDGSVDVGQPLDARISARMTHVFALAHMRGIEGAAHLLDHGLAAMDGPLRDRTHGGWYARAIPTSQTEATPEPHSHKTQRAQAAMIGAACAGILAGNERAAGLACALLEDQEEHWWDPSWGAAREEHTLDYAQQKGIHRLSTNLDTAQAYLLAWEVDGHRLWGDRARSILRLSGELAARCAFALPDLFNEDWHPLAGDEPERELIRPGDTIPGLGLKAARLIAQCAAALRKAGEKESPWMVDTALALYDRALADGWSEDGVGGFVYALDAHGHVRVPERMHWVACEAASAARVLAEVAPEERRPQLATDYARAIAWIDSHARAGTGRWIHELDAAGQVSTRLWKGRPDALTAARMLARGTAPIHLTVTSGVAERSVIAAQEAGK